MQKGPMQKGRGAVGNGLSGRFGLPARETDGDWLDRAGDEGELAPLKTQVTVERPRSVLTMNDSPDIPFDRSLNAYRGCEHGCVYCFARPTHAYHDLSPGLDFETKLFVKPDAAHLLRAAFQKPSYQPEVLAMGTNTDPYQPIERQWRVTRQVLELCRAVRHPVAVTTKSDRILDDLTLLADMAADGLAMVMISLTTLDGRLARAMEPRAAAPHRRLAAVKALADAGVPVTVSISPLIPALNDHELEAIVAAAAAAGARSVVSIPIRLPHEVAPLFAEWLQVHRPDRAERVLSAIRDMRGGKLNDARFFARYRPQGEWGRLVVQRLNRARRAHGMVRRDWVMRTDLFRRPAVAGQGELFG